MSQPITLNTKSGNRTRRHVRVCRLLALLRQNPAVASAYWCGGCFVLHQILRFHWPEAVPWYDYAAGHVYTQIGGIWYDIRGHHFKLPAHATPMAPDMAQLRPHRWRNPSHNWPRLARPPK